MTDEDIDLSDCPEITPEQFAKAVVRPGLPAVNSDRLVQSIQRLAQIGQTSVGGVRRIAYSLEDIKALSLT